MAKRLKIEGPDGEDWGKLSRANTKAVVEAAKDRAAEKGISEGDAREEIIREALLAEARKTNLSGLGISAFPVSLGSSLEIAGIEEKVARNRGWIDDAIEGLKRKEGQDLSWVAGDRRHLLRPEQRHDLERAIYQEMAAKPGRTRLEALENVLFYGDRMMTAADIRKVEKAYGGLPEGHPDRLDDERLQTLAQLRQDQERLEGEEKRLRPWIRRIAKLKSLDPAARSLVLLIGSLRIIGSFESLIRNMTPDEIEKMQASQEYGIEWACRSRVFRVDPDIGIGILAKAESFLQLIFDCENSDALLQIDLETFASGLLDMTVDRLPYPQFFVGLGDGIPMKDLPFSSPMQGADRLLGYLYGQGEISVVYTLPFRQTDADIAVPAALMDNGAWVPENHGQVLHAWLATVLVNTINSNRTVISEARNPSKPDRSMLKRLKRALDLKTLPHAWYTTQMSSRLVTSAIKKLGPVVAHSRRLAYKTDRRAHERCRVQRGLMPRTSKEQTVFDATKKKLFDRGYRFYLGAESLLNEDDERLMVRGMPSKRTGEWLAILVSWVDHHIVGPEDAPYVPRVDRISGPVAGLNPLIPEG